MAILGHMDLLKNRMKKINMKKKFQILKLKHGISLLNKSLKLK